MDEFILSILSVVMADMGVNPEISSQVMDLGTKGLNKIHKINKMPKVINIENLSLAYLKSFRKETDSTLVVCRMEKMISDVINRKPNLSPSVQETLTKRAEEYKVIFAEFGKDEEIIQIQCAKKADTVIENQLNKNNGTLVIE